MKLTQEEKLTRCSACGKQYLGDIGSTPCCGAGAESVPPITQLTATQISKLHEMGWKHVKQPKPYGDYWVNPDHPFCQEGGVIHDDEVLKDVIGKYFPTGITQHEKNQRIAEACGLYPRESDRFGLVDQCGVEVPDYFNDLNAMHEAEKVLLDREIGSSFRLALHKNSDGPESMFMTVEAAMCHATATQRAEAFGLTLNLWEAGQ